MKIAAFITLAAVTVSACQHESASSEIQRTPEISGTTHTVTAAAAARVVWAAAIAEADAEATLSTKLMGTVTAVHVHEGDVVRAGAPLVTIDARDLSAKDAQVAAGVAEAEAVRREATLTVQRIRTLHAEEAATQAQLDAAETGLARAEAAVRAARAARAELSATRGYSVIRAPFAGQITARMVDPGAFAAPGAPLVTIQDAARLRVVGNVAPNATGQLRRGSKVAVQIEGAQTSGVVEAMVPSGGNLYRINVIVDNRARAFLPGTAAAIAVPQGEQNSIYIPHAAVRRTGDLTGVHVKTEHGTQLRWIQLGSTTADMVEVLAGLRPGETIIVPASGTGAE
jgi:RND family efflux transporter MFP subunit